MSKYVLYSDGGARGNPGPAGIGFVLYEIFSDGTKKIGAEHAEYIGEATNNVAEYKAILAGVKKAKALGIKELSCFLDSELVAKQLSQKYKIKDPDLGKLFVQVWNLMIGFTKITFQHIPREENKEADRLVNRAIDSVT
jgi:ribonuclease HI